MVRIRLPPADELPPEQARSPSDLEVVRYWDLAATEDTDDLTADLGRREGGSVYKPTPTVDLILEFCGRGGLRVRAYRLWSASVGARRAAPPGLALEHPNRRVGK